MDDTISRQAAIDAIEQMRNLYSMDDCPNIYTEYKRIIDEINNLPSAQTEYTIEMQEHDIDKVMKLVRDARVTILPSAEPEIIQCKDCKHNPKYEWFGCPMSHLSEAQRPETAWCWKAERGTDE